MSDRLVDVAEDVAWVMRDHGIDGLVIGAVALAAHHYIRFTEGLDIGAIISLDQLRELKRRLSDKGYDTELREPDGDDPLGGVLNVHGDFGLVQVISFAGRFPAVIQDGLEAATLLVSEGSSLRIAPLEHLVALKLYAGGIKSKADVLGLLSRNPNADLDAIEKLCAGYRLRGFSEIRDDLDRA